MNSGPRQSGCEPCLVNGRLAAVALRPWVRQALRVAAWLLCVSILWLGSGCASTSYRYGRFHQEDAADAERQPIFVERGKPHKALDRLAWLVGMPARVFTLNAKTNNHDVSDETIEQLTHYLEANDVTDVYVAVNDYNPKLQWQRLRENQAIAPFWKYTAGMGSWLQYTFVPNRVFGGDEYNPYTNTLIVSSDVPALVLAEAAYAKDIRLRRNPGTYAALNDLPIVSLWRHSVATSDVLGYARANHDWATERQAYEVLYPQIGSTTFGPTSHFVPVAGPFLSTAGALLGHATGRTIAKIQEPVFIDAAPQPAEPAIEAEDAAGAGAGEELAGAKAESGPVQPAVFEQTE